MVKLADNVQAWLRGEDSDGALAGGVMVATLIDCAWQRLVKG